MEQKEVTDEKGGMGQNPEDLALGTCKKKEAPSVIPCLEFQCRGMTRPPSCSLSDSCLRNLAKRLKYSQSVSSDYFGSFQFCK